MVTLAEAAVQPLRRGQFSENGVATVRKSKQGMWIGPLALLLAFGFSVPAANAATGTASVSISPSTATIAAGGSETYTLSVTCSVTGGCDATTVTFPTTTIAGDGATTDFGSWFGGSSCATVTKTVSAGTVTYAYGNVSTGTSQCTIAVTAPYYTTLNGTVATLTPTIAGTGFASATGSPSTLTVTAAKRAGIVKNGPAQVGTGAQLRYLLEIQCGGPGSLGTSAYAFTDTLPANFTYQSFTTSLRDVNDNDVGGTPPGTIAYDAPTHTFSYSDPGGTTCQIGSAQGWDIYVTGTASTGGVPDAPGDTIVNTASASWTYLDGTTGSQSSTLTTSVVSPVPNPFLGKAGKGQTLPNGGFYTFNGVTYPYTYPGDWNRSGQSVQYPITVTTVGTSAGVDFAVQDPVPCLTDFAGGVYSSQPPGGPFCAAPAFIPTVIVSSGFTPAVSDSISVVHTDGSTSSIPFTAGTGWVIPASPAVAEIDIPQFAEEGGNSATTMQFVVKGYAAPTVATTSLLTNTATADAFLVGSSTPLVSTETAKASVMVVSAAEPSGTVFAPGINGGYNGTGTCTENINPYNNLEIAAAPSQPIYVDYLAPAGATVTSGVTQSWSFTPTDGTVGSVVIAPSQAATVTPNVNGTGRTLYEWVIPASVIPQPGDYLLGVSSRLQVNLGVGCAGIYQNDITAGYGAPIAGCDSGTSITPPSNPTADSDLDFTGAPLSRNYCGGSFPLTVASVNPAFSVDKTVQGNLDAAPVSAGGIGNVSPAGGTATYDLTFTNTGQSNLTDPVIYDLLPAVGDTFATSASPRGSQFPVTLTGVGTVPAGVTVSYSTAANPCRPEVLAVNPGCVNDWTTTPPSPLSSVTALKFAYTGTVDVSGGAGPDSFSIPYTVSTPTTTPGAVAWNTVGTTARAGTTAMPPAESSRTGLQADDAAPVIVKTVASPATPVSAVGQVVTYSFAVTNTTAVPLTDVFVDDAQLAPAGALASPPACQALSSPAGTCSGASTTLAPGQTATFTATYAVTQADLDHGEIQDAATATGTPPTGGTITSPVSTATVPVDQAPALTLVKSALPSAPSSYVAGQAITYTFAITNTGNVSLADVTVDETAFTGSGTVSPITCPTTTLSPGEQESCTATYTLTQADVDRGSVSNTADVTYAPPGGATASSQPSSAVVPVAQAPALTLTKSASPTTVSAAGQTVAYDFTVTNTGNTDLSDVTVTETSFTGSGTVPAATCPEPVLAPGASEVCTATYMVTQADVDGGSVSNTATATGTPPTGDPVTTQPSTVVVHAAATPSLTLLKRASATELGLAGEVITYTFAITNTGNVTLSGITVTETSFSGTGTIPAATCPSPTLAPAAAESCTATYIVTEADVAAGLTNTAVASATPPGSTTPIDSNASTAAISAAPGGSPLPAVTVQPPTATVSAGGQLAETGMAITPLLWIAEVLVLLGAALVAVVVARRRFRL